MPLVAKCSVHRLFIVIWNCFGFCLAVLTGFIRFTVDPKLQQTDQTRFDTLSSPITHSVLWTTISSMSHLPMFSSLRLWFPVYDMILWVWFQRNLLHVFFFYFSARIPPDPTIFEQRCVASQGCLLLLYLKQHLKEMYGFSDRLEFPENYFSWLSMIYWYKVQYYSVIHELNWKCWMVNVARFLSRSFER